MSHQGPRQTGHGRNPVNWLGAMRGGRIELSLTPAEVLRRIRGAVPGSSPWERFRAEIEGPSFRLWMPRQVPRLEARVEPLGRGSVVHYEVVAPVDPLVVLAVFSTFVLAAPAVAGIAAREAWPLYLYALLVPFLALPWLLVVAFSRVASRETRGLLHRTFEDVEALGAAPVPGHHPGEDHP
jgi:hypothetical protein